MKHLLLILMLSACASAAPDAQHAQAPAVTTAPVVAAERAFAARGAEIGWIPAFREFAAPNGQVLGPEGYVSAPESLAATPDDGNRLLFWWPAYAGIARSGDFGFTTGPFSVDEARAPRGQYFTVWRRQPDGSWRWLWDGGPGPRPDALNEGVDAAVVPSLPVSSAGVGSEAEAIRQVRALETERASAGALAHYVAGDAQSYRPRRPRDAGAAAETFVFPSPDIAYRLTRIEASSAGDMAMTLGEASWRHDGVDREGFFARIWQHRPEGWRIVYDQLTPRAPPPPPAN